MAKSQHSCYISKSSKNYGQASTLIFRGNLLKNFRLDNYLYLVWSGKEMSEISIINRLREVFLKELKFKNHFCLGDRDFMSICKECQIARETGSNHERDGALKSATEDLCVCGHKKKDHSKIGYCFHTKCKPKCVSFKSQTPQKKTDNMDPVGSNPTPSQNAETIIQSYSKSSEPLNNLNGCGKDFRESNGFLWICGSNCSSCSEKHLCESCRGEA